MQSLDTLSYAMLLLRISRKHIYLLANYKITFIVIYMRFSTENYVIRTPISQEPII